MPFSLISFFPFTLPSPAPLLASLPPDERNLLYVAVTRAKKQLIVTSTLLGVLHRAKVSLSNATLPVSVDTMINLGLHGTFYFDTDTSSIPTGIFCVSFWLPRNSTGTSFNKLPMTLRTYKSFQVTVYLYSLSVERGSVCSLFTGAAPSATVSGEEEDRTGKSL